MELTNYTGIDYSGGQNVNRNSGTGIRYGIIPANDMGEWFWEDVESVYLPYCPKCGNELPEDWDCYASDDDSDDKWQRCPTCDHEIPDGEQWSDERQGQKIDRDGVRGFVDDSNDVWITESPYFTYAQFCSPCAPGACYLRNPLSHPANGNRAYCFGHDWFDDGKAPYPVFSVETGEPVNPD